MDQEKNCVSDTKNLRPALPIRGICTAIVFAGLLSACSGESADTASSASRCEAAIETVSALAPVVGGELAAFAVANEPKKLPELNFTDRDGKAFTTSDFKGKTVLFNLWATWCAPCRKEMPAFDRLEAEFGGEDFMVLPVSVDRGGAEKPLAFFEEIGINHLPFYQDGTMGVFNVLKKQSLAFGLPVTILLDKEGCILGSLNGPAEWAGEDAKKLVRTALGR